MLRLFHSASEEDFASGVVPPTVGRALMSTTMTALRKDDGGVRGIATGLAFRRLVEILARQLWKLHVLHVSSPRQPEQARIMGHVIRALTDANPSLTVTFIDGVGANDHVYRSAMLSKLFEVPKLRGLLPFARFAYAEPTSSGKTKMVVGTTSDREKESRVCAWQLLLQCAGPRCNNTAPPSQSAAYAAGHDVGMQQTMVALLGSLPGDHEQTTMAHNRQSVGPSKGGP